MASLRGRLARVRDVWRERGTFGGGGDLVRASWHLGRPPMTGSQHQVSVPLTLPIDTEPSKLDSRELCWTGDATGFDFEADLLLRILIKKSCWHGNSVRKTILSKAIVLTLLPKTQRFVHPQIISTYHALGGSISRWIQRVPISNL